MLDAQELKLKINDADIIKIIEILDGHIHFEDENMLILNTICHHGKSKNKLYYYKDTEHNKSKYEFTNIFHCYTECASNFDIIELVQKNKELSFIEAMNWISIQLGYDTHKYGFGNGNNMINDWDFINSMSGKRKRSKLVDLKVYDDKILNIFQPMFLKDWIDEGISIESMLKYNISYSTLQQKIIIPHFNINKQLVGIRARSTIDEEVELYGKYTPFRIGNTMYNHSISQNLYGIHINEQAIKRKKKIMLLESEKSILQCDTMFGDDNFTVALSGMSFSDFQRDLILSLGVKEVIVALDKQYENLKSKEALKWSKNIKEKILDKLTPYFVVTVLWDNDGLISHKSSPTDMGKETLLQLLDKKLYIST